jgi:hypothetical protein
MTEFTNVKVPASLPVARLKEFAAANGFKLLFNADGRGFVLAPAVAPSDYPKENSNAR